MSLLSKKSEQPTPTPTALPPDDDTAEFLADLTKKAVDSGGKVDTRTTAEIAADNLAAVQAQFQNERQPQPATPTSSSTMPPLLSKKSN